MRRRAVAIVLLTCVLTAVPAAAQGGSIEELRAKIDAQSERIVAARVRADAASAQFSEAESKLDGITEQIGTLSLQVDQKQAELATLNNELQSFAIDRYMAGGAAESPSIFESSNVNEALTRDALADVIGGQKLDVIDEVRQVESDLAKQSAELEAQKATQEQLTAQLAEDNSRLAKEVAALQAEYDALDQILEGLEEAERQRVLAETRRRAAEEAARKSAERAAAAKRRTTSGGGGGGYIVPPPFQCPVAGGASFTNSWGQPRSGGRRHQGVDMMSPSGTPTPAPVSGVVTYRGNSVGGLSWHLDGDDGNYYYGTHLSRYGEQSGRVSAGTIIGYVGSTGNASTPHLHFEIHPGGQGNAVNPYPTVAAYC
jgi:murein DD-endopeptidase MepM/ murein hydrolase activator NlpD